MNVTKIFAAAALLTLATAGSALAFHDGGVAYCDGCHTMHNSQGGSQMNKVNGVQTASFQGKNFLLKGTDDSSTCLNCHANAATGSYHIMTFPLPAAGAAPVNFNPGGDFAWTQINTVQPTGGRGGNVLGDRRGHNVVASDFGMAADGELVTAPGGTYANTALSCASCHDPHARARIDTTGSVVYPSLGAKVDPIVASGSYDSSPAPVAGQAIGVYRFLAGSNYSQMSYTNATPFNADPPVAVAPSTYNRTEVATPTRVAYGKGMSEWCSNCHRAIHNNNTNAANTALIHPAGNGALLTAAANKLDGTMGTTIATLYNDYKKSGDLTGTQATSYNSLVPYEEGTGTLATLQGHAAAASNVTTGPTTGTENVMCLSCHRAHGSGFSSMTRWNNKDEFLTVAGAWPGSDVPASASVSSGLTAAQYTAAMYNQPPANYAYAQRSLCNKCHAKD